MFGSGPLSGNFAYDDFRLGLDEDSLIVKNQTFGMIIEESVLDSDYDAIIGLAYPAMASRD